MSARKGHVPGVPGCALFAALMVVAGGCEEPSDKTVPEDVTAEVNEDISTVVNVTWTTGEASIGYVQYGPTEEMELNTPMEVEETEDHQVSLLGLTADTEYYYRVVTWDEGDGAASEIATVRTGDLPGDYPRIEVEGSGHDLYSVVPLVQSDWAGITILNSDGKVVWYTSDGRGTDLQYFRARISNDRKSVIYNAASVSGDIAEDSRLVRVPLDGLGDPKSIDVPLLAHDFVEHEDGTLAAITVEYRDYEGEPLGGNVIVEIDPETEEQTVVWTSWDCFDPAVHVSQDLAPQGWTFANALDYDPDEEAYYIGMLNFSSIAKVDRDTAECEWVLGTVGNTFEYASGSARFQHQHQFQVLPGDPHDHILVFDNEGLFEPEASRVLEYELDMDTNTATEVWSYLSDPPLSVRILGEVARLEGGDTFIDWSYAGLLERVSEDGESIWRARLLGSNYIFGFVSFADSLYPPDRR